MPRKATIAPYSCAPLLEGAVAATAPGAPESWQLPATFPLEILTEDQQEAIAAWWDAWVSEMLHTARAALRGNTAGKSKHQGASPADLPTLQLHAVVLAHLLRLHPAAEKSLPKLAEDMGLPTRAVYYARDAILPHLAPVVAGLQSRAATRATAVETLATTAGLDAAAAVQGADPRQIFVPLRAGMGLSARFAVVMRLSRVPGIAAVREDFMPGTTRHAVCITLKH